MRDAYTRQFALQISPLFLSSLSAIYLVAVVVVVAAAAAVPEAVAAATAVVAAHAQLGPCADAAVAEARRAGATAADATLLGLVGVDPLAVGRVAHLQQELLAGRDVAFVQLRRGLVQQGVARSFIIVPEPRLRRVQRESPCQVSIDQSIKDQSTNQSINQSVSDSDSDSDSSVRSQRVRIVSGQRRNPIVGGNT